ncbi:MAG: serine hydrolase [Candidatus Latescibacteria bacterium]|nr:serine hydrolase [Candidatus Latescibacterota bacterium]NIO57307.1 serine hydrolase [Candidatus Latescibacterota bacterium]
MTQRLLVVASVLALLLVASVMPAESGVKMTQVQPELAKKLQTVLDQALETSGTMGASAAVIMPDGRIWTGVSGMSDPDTPVTADMLFDMGSTGKNLFAALVLDLAEEGLLSLDDPINKYLPPYPNVNGAITIRQLLNHTSGLYMWVEHPRSPFRKPYNEIDFEKWWTADEIFSTLGGEPYFSPGEGWRYTQAGYYLGRLIVEQVTGSTVPAEVQKRLLDPLDIHGMLLDLKEPVSANYRIAHNWVDTNGDGVPEDVSARSRNWINSLSGILYYATMEDLAKWLHGLHQGKVLSQASLDEMLDFYSPIPDEGLAGYGLGTEHVVFGDVEMWGHKGSIPGYRAGVYYLPQFKATLALAINSDSDEKGFAMFTPLLEVVFTHTATESGCTPTNAGGTVPPAIAICSVTFVVNGVEQVVRGGDTLPLSAGDEVRFKEAEIYVGTFSGNGGEACVDLAPWDQNGQEIESGRLGTHNLAVSPGLATITGPDRTQIVGENWRRIVAVLNHWPPGRTKDSDCAGGRCERDDRIVIELR